MWFRRRKRPEAPRERRRYLRLPAGASRGTCSIGEVELRDVSPIGLGLATRGSAPQIGDRHLVIVEDHHHRSFEALAETRWCKGPDAAGGYRLGLSLVTVLRDDPGGRWCGVAADPGIEPGRTFRWRDDLVPGDSGGDRPTVVRLSDRRWQRRRRTR